MTSDNFDDEREFGDEHADDSPSRSQQRRDALAVLELADQLTRLPPSRLDALPLTDALLDAVQDARRITQHIAHKRQVQYLAKLLRRDPELVEELRASMQQDHAEARREAARLHRLEQWRERLLDQGDEALGELLDGHPQADRQHLRALIRKAKREKLDNRPPHAFRELFRELRMLFEADDTD